MATILRIIKISLLAFLQLSMGMSAVSASWAYSFVVNDGRAFIVSDEIVEESLTGEVVGEVTMYSTQEGSYNGNFSSTSLNILGNKE